METDRTRHPELPWDLLKRPLTELLVASHNKLEREWPESSWPAPGWGQIVLRGVVLATRNSWDTIVHLSKDDPGKWDAFHLDRFAAEGPTLARTVLDSLFLVCFLFEDAPKRMEWYLRAGYREFFEKNQRYQKRYRGDAAWVDWLHRHERWTAAAKAMFAAGDLAANDPINRITPFPHPGGMLRKDSPIGDDLRTFLGYVRDWFYRSMSQYAHLSLPGLFQRVIPLLEAKGDFSEQQDEILHKSRSNCVLTSSTIALAIVSELEGQFQFGLKQRIREVWGILAADGFWGEATDLFEMRYDDLLR